MTAGDCPWTAVSSDEWITITSGGSSAGNDTVNYSVDVNDSSSCRTGTITIADKTFTVEQSGVNGESWSDNFDGGPQQDWVVVDEGTESSADVINNRYELYTGGSDYTDWIGAAVNVSADDCTIQATVAKLVCDGCVCMSPVLVLRISRSALYFYSFGVVDNGPSFGNISLGIRKRVGGEYTLLAGEPNITSLDMSSPFYMRFSAQGTLLRGKAWNVGDPEPSEWMIEAGDSDIPSGGGGIGMTANFNCSSSQGAFDDVVFTVAAPPPTDPPVADAGFDQNADEGGEVTLDGSNSYDPNGEIVSYLWTQMGGPEVELSDASAMSPTFIAPSVSELTTDLTFQLTVEDNDGLQDTDTCVVTEYNVNVAPIADAGPNQLVNEGVLVTLNGSNSSDPDGTVASYQWTQTGGPSVTLSNSAAVSPAFTAPSVGTGGASLNFQLTVTDNGGVQALQDTDTCIVNVSNVNQAPIANAGPNQAVDEGMLVTLNGSGSTDSDGEIV
ncbi:MAG: PKD domain-containing protein, partial [Deltaproteobacteria bacterium]|nr:PKD domain-containing protein [Deltaproteobacteria bacterium]